MKLVETSDLTKPILQKYLSEGICQVTFKKIDKTVRVLFCTLNPKYLPNKYLESVREALSFQESRDIMPVWDIAQGSWKSFKISNVIAFSSQDELLENDEEGQDVHSDQQEILDKLKEKAQEFAQKSLKEHLEQIEEAKEKARLIREIQKEKVQSTRNSLDQARDIINKLREGSTQRKTQ